MNEESRIVIRSEDLLEMKLNRQKVLDLQLLTEQTVWLTWHIFIQICIYVSITSVLLSWLFLRTHYMNECCLYIEFITHNLQV